MYYSNNTTIDGVRCTVSPVGGLGSGKFRALFERELASLEQIEAISWDNPVIAGDSAGLPAGCGYQVDDITYAHGTRTYQVAFHVLEQYLGDVSGYQARVAQLETDLAAAQEEAENAQEAAQTAQQAAQAAQEQVTALEGSLETAQASAEQARESVTILAGKAVTDGAEARVLRMAIETAVVSLPDDEAAQTPSLSQPWAMGETVEPGDRRYYAPTGLLYKVREGQGHITQESWTPDKTPAMWAVVDVTHAGTAEDPIPAVRSMEYEYGKIYLDPEDEKLYLCQRTGGPTAARSPSTTSPMSSSGTTLRPLGNNSERRRTVWKLF